MSANDIITMTYDEWTAEAKRRFGPSPEDWRFVCPACGNEASGHEFKEAGAQPEAMRCECIGRHTPSSAESVAGSTPCDYAGYGLFRFSPVRVAMPNGVQVHSFAFGESQKEGDRS